FQRVAVIALGVVFLLGALHGPRGRGGRAAWGALALLAAGAGIAVAGRHVWLQNLPPDQVPACGPPFEFMRETLPLAELVSK
ncbi:disulfide bond formation protein B, partial [Acinetobacter baumannii]